MADQIAYCHYAKSLGELEGTPEEAWGTPPYDPKLHRDAPCVFFGLYDLRDYYALWRHQGKKWILWAGSDIRNLDKGFLLNDGKLKLLSVLFRGWFRNWIRKQINRAENWCENETEADLLKKNGIVVTGIAPSYMGDIKALKPRYKVRRRLHIFACAPENRQEEYGWDIIERIAPRLKRHRFHLYGADWHTKQPNIIVHGRVPKEQMNEEIKAYQVGLRLNRFDGFSEITCKGILLGKHVVTRTPYPDIPCFVDEDDLVDIIRSFHGQYPDPNIREKYLKSINNYPWVCSKNH